MFRDLEQFADITPVVASGKATARLPAFGEYQAIHLQCLDSGAAAVSVANILADITNIKLTLNGTTAWEASAAALQKLYEAQYFKLADVAPIAGVLTIPLANDFLTKFADTRITGWGMANVDTFQLELTFGASVATATHISTIEVFVERVPTNAALGLHRRLYTITRNFPSAGDQDITDIPFNTNELTAGLHLLYDGSAAVVNQLELKLNNDTRQIFTPLIQRAVLEKRGRKFMVAGAANDLFQIPFDLSNDGSGYLDHRLLEDMRILVNWSAAPGTFYILREVYVGAK